MKCVHYFTTDINKIFRNFNGRRARIHFLHIMFNKQTSRLLNIPSRNIMTYL